MLFWIAFISTAAVGYFVGTVHGEAAIHTGVAYLYAAGFTLIVLAYVGDLSKEEFQRFIRAMGTVPVLLLSVPLLIFLVGSEWFSELLDINTTFYPSRVAAWSTNPNQLALFLLPVPIWLAAISQDTHWKGWRFFKKFLFLWFIFFLGLCVRSDALLLAWSIGIPMLTIIAGCWLKKVNWKFFGSITAAFVLAFVSFKFFFDGPGQQLFETVRKEMSESVESIHAPVTPVTPVTPELNEQEITASRSHIAAPDLAHVTVVEKKNHDTEVAATPEALAFGRSDSAVGVGMDPNKVGVRKTLWIHAYEVWKLSPIFGHGPGAFSYLDSPDDRQEAHNLLLDMLTQVGIVGVALFASVYLWLIIGAVRARDPYSLTLLVILMVFPLRTSCCVNPSSRCTW